MEKYNFIVFNMSRYADWQKSGVVNRNYHMLHWLAKDSRVNKIISVDFLPFNFKKALKTFFNDQLIDDRRGEVVYGTLTSRAWRVTSKIIVYSSVDSVFKPDRVSVDLRRIVENEEMSEKLIVINYNPLWANYFGQFGQMIDIFDGVDNWSEHASYQNVKQRILGNYRKISEKSDLIYAVSQDLANFLSATKARWLPNAVDPEHFASGIAAKRLEKIPKPHIGFLGILQERIDTDLLKFIATENPDKSIILAGPVWKDFPVNQLLQYPNIHFIGPVAYQDMPSVYKSFDVGIIPYKNNAFIKSTNSMKFYEYLAAGLPVVSTLTGGIEDFSGIIELADSPSDFSRKINSAIVSNSDYLRQQRRDFVKNMTWKNRLNTIFSDISAAQKAD